jgi:pyruvate/2-oxoglutarate dehydrogenase complex dihydrolipoamide dehydrogenase (E3) component
MVETTDVIVLGVGTSGEDVALRLLDAGLEVTGIEARLIGGECAYWACLPSKMMIRSANLVQEARRADGLVGRIQVEPDWSMVAARVRAEVTGGWDDSAGAARFEGKGGRLARGVGRFTAPRTVTVGERTIAARCGVVIATGSQPAIPPVPGLAEVDYWTTHDVIEAEVLPDSLTVLGGGAVGCELGQVLSRFGVTVTIVEARERLLPDEEPEVSEALSTALSAEGITVRAGSPVGSVRALGDSLVATLKDGTEVAGERLLVATGRRAATSSLGLDAAGIKCSGSVVEVDDRLRAAEGVWAIGDVTGKGMFSYVALYQGSIVVADILGKNPSSADYRALPRATFTDPEVGSVGITEAQARAAGLDVMVAVKQVPATFRGWLHGPGNGGVIKLVVDRAAGTLVGATSVGPHGGEVVGMLATALHASMPVEDLVHMMYPFPTFVGGVGEALGSYGRGLVKVLDPGSEPMFGD